LSLPFQLVFRARVFAAASFKVRLNLGLIPEGYTKGHLVAPTHKY
jgi:hypothetical protein